MPFFYKYINYKRKKQIDEQYSFFMRILVTFFFNGVAHMANHVSRGVAACSSEDPTKDEQNEKPKSKKRKRKKGNKTTKKPWTGATIEDATLRSDMQ